VRRRGWQVFFLAVEVLAVTVAVVLRITGRAYPASVILGFVLISLFYVVPALLIVRGSDAWDRRRARSRAEAARRDPEVQASVRRGWNGAQDLMNHLAAGRPLAPMTVWGVVLRPNEQAYLSFPANYARYYSTDASYVHVDGLFLGGPLFVAAGLAMTAAGNRSRRDAALAAAALRWREQQAAQVLLTSERILCNANGRWMSFYFSGVTAFYPEPLNWSVVFEFGDTQPLRLAGESGPAIAAFSAWLLHGSRGVQEHPGLQPLRQAIGTPMA